MVAGSVGPHDRLTYTVLGDEVNVAARLEALNKQFGSRVLVSAATKARCGPGIGFRSMGEASVKGHSAPIRVFAPIVASEATDRIAAADEDLSPLPRPAPA